jgi:citrate lyase subunit beta/citryl-CoA lyase
LLVERWLFVIGNKVWKLLGTSHEIARADANVAAYRESEAKGRGAVGVNGVLVDAAHVKMAEETLARAALINGSRGS